MSGGGIEAVLRDHVQVKRGRIYDTCSCGWYGSNHPPHVAAAALAWLDARLAEVDRNDLIYAVCPDLSHTIWDGHAACEVAADAVLTAALSAVRGVLGGEGS